MCKDTSGCVRHRGRTNNNRTLWAPMSQWQWHVGNRERADTVRWNHNIRVRGNEREFRAVIV